MAIHDFGKDEDDLVYAVTELLEGDTLRERLSDGALPTRKAVEIATQIAQGLGAAHDKGVVHRDLKPENIIVTPEGRAKILDFGLAARAEGPAGNLTQTPTRTNLTEPGSVMGTVGYMSPEQVKGSRPTRAPTSSPSAPSCTRCWAAVSKDKVPHHGSREWSRVLEKTRWSGA